MKEKSKKKAEVEQLHEELEKSKTLFTASFQGINVREDFDLRRQVRGAGGSYKVVANRLARVAAQGTPAEALLKELKGMTSLVFAGEDPAALAKTLTSYAKNHPVFSFRAGMVEGKVINVQGIADLANLPSREAIYAKLLFLINAGAQRLLTVLGAAGRDLAVVIDQGVKEKKFM